MLILSHTLYFIIRILYASSFAYSILHHSHTLCFIFRILYTLSFAYSILYLSHILYCIIRILYTLSFAYSILYHSHTLYFIFRILYTLSFVYSTFYPSHTLNFVPCVRKVALHLGYGTVQLKLKLNGFRPVQTLVDITSTTFYKCTATFRISPPVRHRVPSHFNWTLP